MFKTTFYKLKTTFIKLYIYFDFDLNNNLWFTSTVNVYDKV